MTEENKSEDTEHVSDTVDDAAEEVPTPDKPEQHSTTGDDSDNRIMSAIDAMGNKIVEAINAAKEASPVTPHEEEVLDEAPIRKPWTHRKPFSRKSY